jgi:hypothetical protein
VSPPFDKLSRDEIDAALYTFVRGEPVEREKEAKRFTAIMAELSAIKNEFRGELLNLKEEVKGVKARVTLLEDKGKAEPPRSLSPAAGIKAVKAQSDTGSHLLVEIERGVNVVLAEKEKADDAATLRAMRGGVKKWGIKLLWYALVGALTLVGREIVNRVVK